MRHNWLFPIVIGLLFCSCGQWQQYATQTATGGDLTPVVSEQAITTTPTQEIATWTPEAVGVYAPAFDGFVPLNSNPYLDYITIEQFTPSVFVEETGVAVPRGYRHFWRIGNADGGNHPERDGATIIPVIERQQGLVFDIGGRAAKSGYAVDVGVSGITQTNSQPICLFIQWFGAYAIEDDEYDIHTQNYWVHGFVGSNRGRQVALWVRSFDDHPAANIDPYWTIWITANGTYTVTMYLDMRYATAAPNHVEQDNWVSWFLLRSYWVGIDTTRGHCDDNTPMIG